MAMLPYVSDGFVMDVTHELAAVYRLNAFTSADAKKNRSIPRSSSIDDYFSKRFSSRAFSYTASGRHGIFIALEAIGLKPDDCVTILTTTDNFYISGCVTKEIEKFCSWSREIKNNTRAIFVNHEFGHPYSSIESLKKHGVPIIEDCCYAFNSKHRDGEPLGLIGDFSIYSFAKFFPIQFGGLIVCNNDSYNIDKHYLNIDSENYLKSFMSYYEKEIEFISEKRRGNHEALSICLSKLGLSPRFELLPGVVPGVYMFVAPDNLDLNRLKSHLWERGIHCSVFYGEQAFFVPVHQGLDSEDFDYFYICINEFINISQGI